VVWDARHEGMAPDIDGKVIITDFEGVNDAAELPPPGTMATIEVTDSKDYDLIGRAIKFAPPALAPSGDGTKNLFPILTR
jgi:TRAM domain